MGQPGWPPHGHQPGHRRRSSASSAPHSPAVRHVDSPKPVSPASSRWSEDGSESGSSKSGRLPGFAVPMQSALLKRISAFRTKEELLEFLGSYLIIMDEINKVTCLYRLAKLSFSQRSRSSYLAELQRSPNFQLLLRSISAQFLHAQLQYMQHRIEPRGADARCLANLVWALAKLDLSSDEAALSNEIALNVAPFVLRSLGSSSPQGLANTLWSYAKLPAPPIDVVAALVARIGGELRSALRSGSEARPFDAQALSNSIWALAHLKSRGMELEAFGSEAVGFLEAVAAAATRMLSRLQQQLLSLPRGGGGASAPDASQLLAAAEADFSCQALVNIAWALATIAGPACATHAPFRALFAVVNAESIGRLRATAVLLRARAPLPYHGGGQGFNEQALSNEVYAFDKAGLLQRDLLAAILDVATLRLQLGGGPGGGGGSHDGGAGLSFKPQELVTLLKACHSGVAPPWGFLSALLQLLAHNPAAVDHWSQAERAELQRAYLLYRQHTAQAAAAAAGAGPGAGLGGAGGGSALLAQLSMLEAQAQAQAQHAQAQAQQQQQESQQQQQALVAALAGALEAQRQQQQVLAALAGAQQAGALAQRAFAPGGAAAARPPPAPAPYGRPPSAPLPSGAIESALCGIGGASTAGSTASSLSPRTPLAKPRAGAPPGLPVYDQGCNKQQRVRLAHAPPQEQMRLYSQLQERLAGEGLATSAVGSLWPGGGATAAGDAAPAPAPAAPMSVDGGEAAGGGLIGGHPAVDAAALRPWLLEAAAAAAAAAPPTPLAGTRA
ncbi:hypothetical protein Rsub_07558 [Raphidocelis subcapitata]|uniref:Uncharacterized protein n=1 Tax=Raphidocelis subcapitata TaxID=307507 RepID=A0A2V0PD10_9CHLO|nr:hypothetical protein Rsub_07558 [Raphidocelis subcapitata]|eukprot:GBF95057.1 hypothetical protein Rsub_07558 [Raphidocelis subcapitata]